ncbi:hypothetical protein KMZ32_18760 [Phycicoccus sp. MAQZ13P-2]|uniref:hypothetical protein n=1 Tax=Phycicoccus mangrovi TaxID=2840470 RepID=UPI001BFFFF46|nr:hypothetical protein [Phycicoccus mangrovi]MBT9276120.1 hypothetical protein [Phycicoccus mangrovi]
MSLRSNTAFIAATASIAIIASGCSDGASPAARPTPSATAASTYDASSASDAEKWSEYQRLLEVRAVPADKFGTSREEAPSVAANLCDNSAEDMATYVQMQKTLHEDPSDFRVSKLEATAFTKAYCPQVSSSLESAYLEAESAAQDPVVADLAPADFKLGVKIKRRKCFGSAGCNVTYVIEPEYVGFADVSTGSYDITYEVSGVEDGPAVNTMTLEDGTMSFDSEESASTTSSKAKLKAKVTDVSPTQ